MLLMMMTVMILIMMIIFGIISLYEDLNVVLKSRVLYMYLVRKHCAVHL